MKAIQVLDPVKSVARYLATKILGAVHPSVAWGPLALIAYREVPEPVLPGPKWVKVRTVYGGICGSDMNIVFADVNPALASFVSLPATLGHENVGVVAEIGSQVEEFSPGDRVVADPLLPCAARGIEEECAYCRRGESVHCRSFTEGNIPPGISIGTCGAVGGSWSAYFVAHESQLFHVPGQVSDENALMAEPASVALRAVVRNFPAESDTVLVLGAGTAGLCVIAALRALAGPARVIAVARYAFQAERAMTLGADQVILAKDVDYLDAVAKATGGKVVKARLAKPFLVGGADIVYECVGHDRSVNDALRSTRAGGTVVLVGMARLLRGVDWTPIWLNELSVRGTVWGGRVNLDGRDVHAFELALGLMAECRLDLASLITHRYELDEYKQALSVVANKRKNPVIKAVFEFD